MKFSPLPLEGAYLIDLDLKQDERGFFARCFCSEELGRQGLETVFVQINNSLSNAKGTLRGMHYQLPPKEETKLVRCVRGSVYDVILDLRPSSTTFGRSFGALLSEGNRTMMYVPKGFAHGFLSLEPNAELIYLVSTPYCRELERGVRWDDPAFAIAWPEEPLVLSERDRSHPEFDPTYHLPDLAAPNKEETFLENPLLRK